MSRHHWAVWLLAVLTALAGVGCGGEADDQADDQAVRSLDDGSVESGEAGAPEADTDPDSDPDSGNAQTEPGGSDQAGTDDASTQDSSTSALAGDSDGDGVLSDGERQARLNELFLEFSACMRDNGYPDFEDLTIELFAGANGQGQSIFFELLAERGVELSDQAALDSLAACGAVLSELAATAPQPSDEQQAQREAQSLDFAQCMREEGLSDFPDPDFASFPGLGYGLALGLAYDFENGPAADASAACTAQGRGFLGGGTSG